MQTPSTSDPTLSVASSSLLFCPALPSACQPDPSPGPPPLRLPLPCNSYALPLAPLTPLAFPDHILYTLPEPPVAEISPHTRC
ncbi:hypothetical protein CDL15_Pgr010856 [Punica granatum]|uniref:Uncharacterized protein n=1 Tax=Punica granatum TaxID=22663 RepID=A0A218W601_PUNGR|nr:hypothetical protein CDL15_Pgr010856 [Punica granatum]